MVSVVIPTYNMGKYVTDAIESVMKQTHGNYEIIVVDDGSVDSTEEVLQGYKGRIRYIWQDNCGVAEARNRGIRAAKGEYVAFLDADDVWLPRKLEVQLSAFEKNGKCGLVGCGYSVCEYPEGRVLRSIIRGNYPSQESLLSAMYICQLVPGCSSGAVIRRVCFEEVGVFDPSIRIGEDWDMWLRIMSVYSAYFVEEILVYIRQVPAKMQRSVSEESQVGYVIEKTVPPFARQRSFAALYARMGSNALAAGRHGVAFRYLVKSMYCYPRNVYPFDVRNRYQYPKVSRAYLTGKSLARLLYSLCKSGVSQALGPKR